MNLYLFRLWKLFDTDVTFVFFYSNPTDDGIMKKTTIFWTCVFYCLWEITLPSSCFKSALIICTMPKRKICYINFHIEFLVV